MRNLKKVLSLVLCVAMMLSVMVVGAGAAFSDQSLSLIHISEPTRRIPISRMPSSA